MNYFNKFKYHTYKVSEGDFNDMLDGILAQMKQTLSEENKAVVVLRLVCFYDVTDNNDYECKLKLLSEKVNDYFLDIRPAVTLVAQKPLDSKLIVEMHSYLPDDDECVGYKSYEGFPYVVIANKYGKFLFAGGLRSSIGKDRYFQSTEVFRLLDGMLHMEKMPVSAIVRQWNYIEKITESDRMGNQNYQMFNNARSEYYLSGLWYNGFPAATGIGMQAGGVVVDVDLAVMENPEFRIIPIDNKLQVAAHVYSDFVLEKAGNKLSTPKFERAKSLCVKDCSLIYISGTAAIRGERSVNSNIGKQLEITKENINQLVPHAKIKLLRIYLKDINDYEHVLAGMHDCDDVALSYLKADICRRELLVEIEGIAIK